MGSGASKRSAKSGGTAVIAEVVVPGQSQAVKVKGHVRPGSDNPTGSLEGGARLTEVAPKKYNVKIGNRDVGTFDVPNSDFASYLKQAAAITVKSVEAVNGAADFTPPGRLQIPLNRQTSLVNGYDYSDDEDWEDVADSLDQSGSKVSNDRRPRDEAKERRAKIKQAIREKREKLTQQEYQEMIANHKQEMELMAILREREKERHQMKLGSKVAERKRRREARLAEKRDQEKLIAEENNTEVPEDSHKEEGVTRLQEDEAVERDIFDQLEGEMGVHSHQSWGQKKSFLNKLAATKANKVLDTTELQGLEAELEEKQRVFNALLKDKKGQLSDEDYKRLIAQHKRELGRMQEKLDLQRGRQRQAMLDKLTARRRMRDRGELDDERLSADEIKELQLALNHRAMAFRDELKEAKSHTSPEECQQLIDQHRLEMEGLQNQLDEERERMRKELIEKLKNRKRKSKESLPEETCFTTEELKQLQLAVDIQGAQEKQRIAGDKNRVSNSEYRLLLDLHQREVEAMEGRLNEERELSRRRVEEKLAGRRDRRPMSGDMRDSGDNLEREGGLGNDAETLEETMKAEEKRFREEVEERRSGMSEEEYRRLLEQHQAEMGRLQERLKQSQEGQKRRLEDKLAERRRRRERAADNKGADKLAPDDVQSLQEQIDAEESRFKREVENRKSEMSEEEYRQLLERHRREMEGLRERLRYSQEGQKRRLEDKLAGRRRRRERAADRDEGQTVLVHQEQSGRYLKLESESDFIKVMAILDESWKEGSATLTERELTRLTQDLKTYSQTVFESLDAKRGTFPEADLELMISEHRRDTEAMASRLAEQRARMEETLNQKLRSRHAKAMSEYSRGGGDDVREARVLHQAGSVSSCEEEEEQVDELWELSDIGVMVPQLATTQFWTTPIQSRDLLIVPLSEEYPVQRKSELYTDPSIFRDLDAHAIRLAQTVSLVTQPTFSSLVDELTGVATSELERARLVFRWITAQNCDEMNLNDVVDDTPLGVLKGLYQKKITFSTLFMRMCRFIGLQCVEIPGIARVKGYTPGIFIEPTDPSYHHTWNAVRIEGFWHFVDCNWGVSHIHGSVTFDPFRFEYDEHYFLADPGVMISSHYPKDPSWQLLDPPISLETFNDAVLLRPDFFKYGFKLQTHCEAVLRAVHGEIDVRVKCPQGFVLSCRLSDGETGSQTSADGVPYDQFGFIHQVGESSVACYIRVPEVGMFFLTIFARKQFTDDGQLNIESPTEICQYVIHCTSPSADPIPLPPSPGGHWGPIGVRRAGLDPISHASGVIIAQGGGEEISVAFRRTGNVSLCHTLTCWKREEEGLKRYAIQRAVDDRVIFTVAPPSPDRYGLHMSMIVEEYSRPLHLCSYLIVVNSASAKPSPVEPFPALREKEKWGVTEAFARFGLFQISHPDPYIITRESIVILEIGLESEGVDFSYHFYFRGQEAREKVEMQSARHQCSFIADLQEGGFYVLKVFAREAQHQEIPFLHVGSFLIKKT